MGMERLPGPVCNECSPMVVEDGTTAVCSAGTPGIALEHPAEAAGLLRLYRDITGGAFGSCPDWNDLARMRDFVHALPPSGVGGVLRSDLVQTLYGVVVAATAERHLDVREVGTNAGEDVVEMLEAVGRHAGDSWCAAFVAQCHRLGAQWLCGMTTCPQEAAVQFLWGSARAAGLATWTKDDVLGGSARPMPGDVFIMARASGYSEIVATTRRVWNNNISHTHTGLVIDYDPGAHSLTTIEGNTGPAGGREGDGVYMKSRSVLRHPSSSAMAILAFIRPGVVL